MQRESSLPPAATFHRVYRRQASSGAVRHGEMRDGIRPNPQLVEIEADAKVDLLRIGRARTVDSGRIGRGIADVVCNEIDPLL